MYHGPSRNASPKFLAGHDIVLTTYATLASDFKVGWNCLAVR